MEKTTTNRKIRKPIVALPLFVKAQDIPKDISDYEILVQAEKVVGHGRAKVAQKIDGVWRVHMSDSDARNKLLSVGLTIRGKRIDLCNEHPHTLRDEEGNLIETTKLTISNIPWSLNEQDIFDALDQLNVVLMSDINPANCRSPTDQSLTKRFYNAKLYAYIKKPEKVLPQYVNIGQFRAYLSYKEQLADTVCSNCLQKGHTAKKCPNPTVCLVCHKQGHKKGDKQCMGTAKNDQASNSKKKNPFSEDMFPKTSREEGELTSEKTDDDGYTEVEHRKKGKQRQEKGHSWWNFGKEDGEISSESSDEEDLYNNRKSNEEEIENKIIQSLIKEINKVMGHQLSVETKITSEDTPMDLAESSSQSGYDTSNESDVPGSNGKASIIIKRI